MIISMNDSNQMKYVELFRDAYEFLWNNDTAFQQNHPNPNEDKEARFTSLNEYYAHIADFFNHQQYRYIMLPLDEPSLEINLNTRTIAVPSDFSKCASVQKDQLAELIVFTVDRFFDYMDLANTHIYVQWTTPAAKGSEAKQGASLIEMKDLESLPGKLRFAWPLTDEITATPGTVRFSVRFFRLGTDNELEEGSNKNLVYSLNTLEAGITIKSALQPDLNEFSQVEKPVANDLFKNAIVNSQFSASGLTPPQQPEFREPGTNMTATTGALSDGKWVAHLVDDTVTMYVQAVTSDAGMLSYKWYHKADGTNSYVDCEAANFGVIDNNKYIAFSDAEMKILAEKGRVPREKYYIKESDGAYTEFTKTGDAFLLALTEWKNDFPSDNALRLYQKYSAFTVPAEGPVTGAYQASVTNTVMASATDSLTTVNPTYSMECVLPAPKDIEFAPGKNLPIKAIMDINDTANIGVTLIEDSNAPVITYNWKRSDISADSNFNDVEDNINNNQYTVTKPGWYTVDIISNLNRTNKTLETANEPANVCKVTRMPTEPIVQYYNAEKDTYVDGSDENMPQLVWSAEQEGTLKVKASVANTDENLAMALLTDEYVFEWYTKPLDSQANAWVRVTEEMPYVVAIVNDNDEHTSTLTIANSAATTSMVHSFKCVVTNKLNGESATYDHTVEDANNLGKDFSFIVLFNQQN